VAELVGTFWLVLGGCGSAVLAAAFPYATEPERTVNLFGLGFLGVSLAFGLSVLTMAYAIGHVSGCHLNPAVSVGLWAAGRFPNEALLPYVVAQVLGAIAGGGFVYLVASGREGFVLSGSNPLATNGYGAVAVFAGTEFVSQLWMFWLVPLAGAALAGPFYRAMFGVGAEAATAGEALDRSRVA
jgi:aquaporin Z